MAQLETEATRSARAQVELELSRVQSALTTSKRRSTEGGV